MGLKRIPCKVRRDLDLPDYSNNATGVMRFLQTEWHSHERARNSWEIEREEMKKRIAGLEGEARSSKGLRGVLERQIRMLEFALRKERENVNKLKKGETVDTSVDTKEVAREEISQLKTNWRGECTPRMFHTLLTIAAVVPKTVSQFDNEIDAENHLSQGIKQEKEREKSKSLLNNSISEVTYHMLPGMKSAEEMANLSNLNGERQPSQQELYEAYAQVQSQKQQAQQQQQQQQHQNNMVMVREIAPPQQSIPAYSEPAPIVRSNTQVTNNLSPQDTRYREQPIPSQPSQKPAPPSQEQMPLPEEQVESISHSYDGYGRQVNEENPPPSYSKEADVTDGWDFDDGPSGQSPVSQNPRPDTEAFPSAISNSKSPTRVPGSHRRKSSGARRKSSDMAELTTLANSIKSDNTQFKVRFAMRGHLDVVRAVIFTGGGSPSDPEFCTAGDDGTVKRWHIPAGYGANQVGEDLDRIAHFTHRGHVGSVCSLAACPASLSFSNGGRVAGDGWIFSGGEDTSVKVWERGRVDSKASLEGHTDAVWALCVLPGTSGSILGDRSASFGGPDRVLLAAGASNGTILVWAVSAPPQSSSVSGGSNRGARGSRRANSISAGSNFPSSPQPSVASNTPFNYSLVHRIERPGRSPTSISPLSPAGINFVVSYSDASVVVFDTRTGEELIGMASQETYDGSPNTGVNSVVATSTGFDTTQLMPLQRRGSMGEDDVVHGATGSEGGVEGLVIAGYEDRYIRFFDANSGKLYYDHAVQQTNTIQVNVHTLCSPILRLSLHCHSRPMVAN